ncbi:MAG: tyrosine--tRNA ligase, partial [Desulfitobacteriaceae bacterium]
HGLTIPLVTKSDGTKFGKTESGTIWLDANKTSPYAFYQFWLNTDDRDVIRYLNYFTFLSLEEISELAEQMATEPEKRNPQRTLAKQVTALVHGQTAMQRAEKISQALFTDELTNLSAEEIEEGLSDVPSTNVEDDQISLVELLVQIGAASSKRQSRESIQSGAIYINDIRCTNIEAMVPQLERLAGKYLVIRRGKKNYYLIKFAL